MLLSVKDYRRSLAFTESPLAPSCSHLILLPQLGWLTSCSIAREAKSYYLPRSIPQEEDTCYFFCLCGNVALLLILLFNLTQTMQRNFLPEASILLVPGVPSRDCRLRKGIEQIAVRFRRIRSLITAFASKTAVLFHPFVYAKTT